MFGSRGILLGAALLSTTIACTRKDADDKPDSSAASTAASGAPVFDKAAAIAAIHANNDLWLRSAKSGNLDSLMSTYASDACPCPKAHQRREVPMQCGPPTQPSSRCTCATPNSTSTTQFFPMMERWAGMTAPSLEPSMGPEESQ